MRRILTIIGTRPEAIKLCPVVHEFRRLSDQCEALICLTGQHRQMLDQVMDAFELTADFDMNLMAPNQSLAQITARATQGLDEVMQDCCPDIVIVQGDTTTAFCGALVGFYHRKIVGHVEAGLRTGNRFAPFPEEVNRCLISRIADWHFAPTEFSAQALRAEGIDVSRVVVTGNTVIDALLWMQQRVARELPDLPDGLNAWLGEATMVLITGHRRESFGEAFENICHAINDVAHKNPDTKFVYPVHLNPQVREPVFRILGSNPRIRLIEPQAYQSFVWLMNRATIVLTDSGGVQEEAPALGKPVLVMRETTERPEGIAAGNALLVGTSRDKIAGELHRLLNDDTARAEMATKRNPYGDGTAAKQIAAALLAN
ncbi:MAG TPA: UDP-N-acetylglucosamine 2-epimerase (non-hydrolyzing) [Pirellulaceae bacterium]|nr:UDP-N-acetylglucosamine 2-epimerase (non-hydrolyzing) [Pirellulaceae bacterium]HMO92971.1 UDP-N-acetylglucosamine 2-epimerase (non-hydrolyzing) [Pirellulaceae bacterium]HMP67951.1 UDP-N-acetylglucosamine 2-epimerase (non-hydrolyzing) [Pirellulaceae bacterium]